MSPLVIYKEADGSVSAARVFADYVSASDAMANAPGSMLLRTPDHLQLLSVEQLNSIIEKLTGTERSRIQDKDKAVERIVAAASISPAVDSGPVEPARENKGAPPSLEQGEVVRRTEQDSDLSAEGAVLVAEANLQQDDGSGRVEAIREAGEHLVRDGVPPRPTRAPRRTRTKRAAP